MLRAVRGTAGSGRCPSLVGCLNDALRGAHRAAAAAAGGAPPQPLAGAVAPRRGVATAMDLLKRKSFHDSMLMIAETATMREAAAKLAAVEDTKALMVTRNGRVVGLLSVADVLRALRNPAPGADGLDRPAREFMTPSPTVVYAAPDDNLMALSLLMTERRVSHLPILDHGQVVGLVTINDIVRMTLEQVRGGKANAVGTVLPRRGLAADTRVATRSPMHHDHQHAGASGASGQHPQGGAAGRDDRLGLATGVASLPRQARSPAPIEDAFFVAHVKWPRLKWQHQHPADAAAAGGGGVGDAAPAADDGGGAGVVSYVGVADGVGSWRGVGVNPRDYAARLMEHAAEAVWRAAVARVPPPSPQAALTAAWEATNAEQVVGSATAIVMMLDAAQNQLTVHGVGDCGVILLRDTRLDRVGTLLRGGTQAGIAPGWRVSARATQQLKGFNQPFQLGFAPGQEARFEAPWHGETLVLPVQEGDIVIAASDGLFDNVDETDILALVQEWAKGGSSQPPLPAAGHAAAAGIDAAAPHPQAAAAGSPRRPALLEGTDASATALAALLAERAAAYSVDRMRDGPFARLAKENDVLWTKGGRPDDITVAVARVTAKAATAAVHAGGAHTIDARALLHPAHAATGRAARLSASAGGDPTDTGIVSAAVATPECGEDATLRILPRLLAHGDAAAAAAEQERRLVAEVAAAAADKAAKDAADAAAASAAATAAQQPPAASPATPTKKPRGGGAATAASGGGKRKKKDAAAAATGTASS